MICSQLDNCNFFPCILQKNTLIDRQLKIVSLSLQARGKKRQKGWFPASHVKLLGSNSGKSTPASAASEKQHKYTGLIYFSVYLSLQLSLSFLSLVGQVIAIYDYTAANEDELSFSKCQIINVLDKSDPDWWKGELNGVTGLIPTNYVKLTTSDSDPSQQCKQRPINGLNFGSVFEILCKLLIAYTFLLKVNLGSDY